MPATNLVVHIEPGPIPTFIISTPSFDKKLAASAEATFPAQSNVPFFFIFFIFFIIYATFLGCPWAVSTTIKLTRSLIIATALESS